MTALLDGVVVLELGNGVPVGYAGRVLRSLGARVIKAEAADDLDSVRGYGASCSRHAPLACSYWHLHGAKTRVILDCEPAALPAVLADWMGAADITIAGSGPLGDAVEAAVALPAGADASVVRIVGSTTDVPGVVLRADESAGMATGLRDQYGMERPPEGLRFDISEVNTASKAAATAALALVRTDMSQPARVDIGVYEASFSMIEIAVQTTLLGELFEGGGVNIIGSPLANPHFCADGKAVLINIYGRGVWERTCRAIGRMDLVDDPRFVETFARWAYGMELRELLDAFCTAHDRETVIRRLWEERVPSAPVLDVAELLRDPQVQDRGIAREGGMGSCFVIDGERDPLLPATREEMTQALALLGATTGEYEEGLHAVRVHIR